MWFSYDIINHKSSESRVNDKKQQQQKKYPFYNFFVRFHHFINFLTFSKRISSKKFIFVILDVEIP